MRQKEIAGDEAGGGLKRKHPRTQTLNERLPKTKKRPSKKEKSRQTQPSRESEASKTQKRGTKGKPREKGRLDRSPAFLEVYTGEPPCQVIQKNSRVKRLWSKNERVSGGEKEGNESEKGRRMINFRKSDRGRDG